MSESSLKISSTDIGKVLSQVVEWTPWESRKMQRMIAGRFDEIMGIIEADDSVMMLVHNCVKNPRNQTCLDTFRRSLLNILMKKEAKWWEKFKTDSDVNSDEEDSLGELGKKIQTLYLEDWHSEQKITEFCTTSVQFIDLFIGFYDLSTTESESFTWDSDYQDTLEDDEDEEDDFWEVVKMNPYDLTVIKIIVSAMQSYLEYLNTNKDKLLAEVSSERWNHMHTLAGGLRWLSFRHEIGKSMSSLEYKYANIIVDFLVKWDAMVMKAKGLQEWDNTK